MHILIVIAIVACATAADPVAEYVAETICHDTRSERVCRHAESYARELVAACRREGRRRGIDWRALLAVAEVETRYQWWRRRPQDGAHGPWQITPAHTLSRQAQALLAGCGARDGICEAPRVAERRSGAGRWSPRELRDPWLAAYIAAWQVQQHVLWCTMHHRRGHWTPRGCPRWLARWGHYQSGIAPPRRYYVRRLCDAWRRIVAISSR